MAAVHADLRLQELAEQLADDARGASQAAGSIDDTVAARMHANYRELKSHEKPYRRRIIENSVSGQIDVPEALTRLDAMRWLRRGGYHVWRIVRHVHVLDASDEVLARALQRKLDQDNQEAPESSQDAPVPGLRL